MNRIAWLSLLALSTGCALSPTANEPPGASAVEYGVETKLRGQVVEASESGGFVVMDFGLAGLPPVGAMVDALDEDEVVGRVRVSGPARDTIIAGDVVSGEVRRGHRVVYAPEPEE